VLKTALQLARRGVYVFPCRPRAKEPATLRGLKDASRDPDVIRAWWRTDPTYNVAIVTGQISGLFVVDVDGLDAEAELRKLETEHGLPPSVEAITPRPGRHIYFRWPGTMVRNSASKIANGIDTRGLGGYVLAPPSVHPSGRRYAWSVDCHNAIAAAPPWLLAKLTASTNDADVTPLSEWRNLASAGVEEGQRNHAIARLTGHLLRRYIDPVVVLDVMLCWNAVRCRPPLSSDEVTLVVNSIASRELKRRSPG
jgi:Bifunctional DNA primase/polymerase, N-terminal/Primase C terminal 1 (PriCT-1)